MSAGKRDTLLTESEAKSPAYTVVTPFYNSKKTLARTIQAIQQLDPPPQAIYMVDDASTDRAAELAWHFDGVTVIVLDRNGGQSRARNVGAAKADTDLLLMIDSDCYINPPGFKIAYERLVDTPVLAGIMGVPHREGPPGPFAGVFKNYWYNLEFEAWGQTPKTLYGSCFLMRREAYWKVGGFDESFGRMPCEDNEFYFRLVQAGYLFERRMDFTFFHDKRMSLPQLLRTNFERSAAIVMNMRGKMGARGDTWQLRERVWWMAEIAGGSLAIAGLPLGVLLVLAAAQGLVSAGLGMAILSVGLAGLLAFLGCIGEKAKIAYRDKGLAFAAKALVYRMLEMLSVVFGILWGLLQPAKSKQ